MAVDSKHPLYSEFLADWEQLRDCYRGERIVKEAGTRYLPATSGMESDGMETTTSPGFKAYVAYRTRARYPDFVKEAVESMLGVMHNKPPQIELPAKMEPPHHRPGHRPPERIGGEWPHRQHRRDAGNSNRPKPAYCGFKNRIPAF